MGEGTTHQHSSCPTCTLVRLVLMTCMGPFSAFFSWQNDARRALPSRIMFCHKMTERHPFQNHRQKNNNTVQYHQPQPRLYNTFAAFASRKKKKTTFPNQIKTNRTTAYSHTLYYRKKSWVLKRRHYVKVMELISQRRVIS